MRRSVLLLLFGLVFVMGTANAYAQASVIETAAKADAKYGKLEPLVTSDTTVLDWSAKRARIASVFTEFCGDAPTSVPDLRPRIIREEKLDGYIRRKVRYLVEPDEDCTAYLLVPDAAQTTGTKLPAILACHQTAESAKEELCGIYGNPKLAYAVELVKRGYVVLAPDSITAGDRIYAGYEPFETAAFDRKRPQWSAVGKMMWDHQRGLDYLVSLPFVNADRIGAIGHSLGAYNAFFLAAVDPRVKAVAESCGYTTIASDEGRERWSRTLWFVHFPKLRPFVEPGSKLKPPFELHELLALVAPRPLFQSVGLKDKIFPSCDSAAQVQVELEKLYELLGATGKVQMHLFDGPHDFPDDAREKAFRFLDTCLK